MKQIKSLLGTLAISFLFSIALADFWIWHFHDEIFDYSAYIVWDNGPPSCDDVVHLSHVFYSGDDVSGDKVEIRCEGQDMDEYGCAFASDPTEVDVLEMNFYWGNPTYHWTIYKNVGYPLVGLDGRVWGTCSPQPTTESGAFFCHWGTGFLEFHCVGGLPGRPVPSAAEINQLYSISENSFT